MSSHHFEQKDVWHQIYLIKTFPLAITVVNNYNLHITNNKRKHSISFVVYSTSSLYIFSINYCYGPCIIVEYSSPFHWKAIKKHTKSYFSCMEHEGSICPPASDFNIWAFKIQWRSTSLVIVEWFEWIMQEVATHWLATLLVNRSKHSKWNWINNTEIQLMKGLKFFSSSMFKPSSTILNWS